MIAGSKAASSFVLHLHGYREEKLNIHLILSASIEARQKWREKCIRFSSAL